MQVERLKGESRFFVDVGETTGNIYDSDIGEPWYNILSKVKEIADKVTCFHFNCEVLDGGTINYTFQEARLFSPIDQYEEKLFECYSKTDCILLGTINSHMRHFSNFEECFLKVVKWCTVVGNAYIIKDSKSELWSLIHVVGEKLFREKRDENNTK